MRKFPILGLCLALPLFVASIAFACEASSASANSGCYGYKASTAATASSDAPTYDAQVAGCEADCTKACCAAASVTTADTKTANAACGDGCTKVCCAGADATAISYSVAGMTCMGCVKQVEAAVAQLDIENIESVTVSLEDNAAMITTNGPVDAKAIQKAITAAGFEASYVTAETEDSKMDQKEAEESAATM